MKRGLVLFLLLLLASPSMANTLAPPGRPPDSQHAMWLQRLTQARDAVEQAREAAIVSDKAYSRMRSSRKLRGEKREALVDERAQAKLDLVDAERNLDIVLEQARRAGVPPGWVREAMAGFDPPAAPAN